VSSMWHSLVSTDAAPPTDRDLAVAVIDDTGTHELVFPCRYKPPGRWVRRDGRLVDVHPTHWRDWPLVAAQ
jgi:hypothetical protein